MLVIVDGTNDEASHLIPVAQIQTMQRGIPSWFSVGILALGCRLSCNSAGLRTDFGSFHFREASFLERILEGFQRLFELFI